MLTLDKFLTLDAAAIKSANLAEEFEAEDRRRIGEWVWEGYNTDRQSRMKWETRTAAAMDLAMQIVKTKSFPWPNCSNIAFPLVTIATLQFHSRAYPALIQAPDVVKCRVNGPDQDGKGAERASRVGHHMSWQCLEEDQPWEEGWDRALINTSVVGCTFKKSYHSVELGHNASELVYAKDLVLDYWAKSVEDCPRKTHVIPLSRNDIYERVKRGSYCDVLEEGWYKSPSAPTQTMQSTQSDNRAGQTPPAQVDETTPFLALEQHVLADLDGDGYAEPYIITVEEKSRCLLRIVCGFDREADIERNKAGEIIRVRGRQYFTKIPFLPSPDGGIYDMGFGVLLGPLNESVNSLINQIVDSGSLKNGRPTFLGRGAKIRGGVYNFAPFSAVRVDSTGDDLRKSILPLDVGEPSAVLFQVLTFLVEYANRIPGTTEVTVGENPGQNTPAETSRNMMTQGLKIYSAIFKRIWRAMGEEFKKLYILNAVYLPDAQTRFGVDGVISRADYFGPPSAIVPEADPSVVSDAQRMQQQLMVAQRMMAVPGYNIPAAERALLKALGVRDIETIYPGPDKVPPLPNPKMQVEQVKLQAKQMAIQAQNAQFAAKLMEDHALNAAKILQLEAQAAKLIEEAGGVKTGHEIAVFEAAIGAMKVHNEAILGHIQALMKGMEGEDEQANAKPRGMGRVAATPGDAGLALLGDAGAGSAQAGVV